MKNKEQIIFIHCLNNLSGSPRVLRDTINAIKKNYSVILITNRKKGNGFLSNIQGITYDLIRYNNKGGKINKAIQYVSMQVTISIKILKYCNKKTLIYFNTSVHFIPEIIAWFLRAKIIVHLHEVSIRPLVLKKIYFLIMELISYKIICVSEFVLKEIQKKKAVVIPNSLGYKIENVSKEDISRHFEKRKIILVASINNYKGYEIFINLANRNKSIKFCLILNNSKKEISDMINIQIPANCEVIASTNQVKRFIDDSSIIISLTKPEYCKETFGLTILEGMSRGLPAIVPGVGGEKELVDNGINGFYEIYKNIESIEKIIYRLLNNKEIYVETATAAYKKSLQFDISEFNNRIYHLLNEVSI